MGFLQQKKAKRFASPYGVICLFEFKSASEGLANDVF